MMYWTNPENRREQEIYGEYVCVGVCTLSQILYCNQTNCKLSSINWFMLCMSLFNNHKADKRACVFLALYSSSPRGHIIHGYLIFFTVSMVLIDHSDIYFRRLCKNECVAGTVTYDKPSPHSAPSLPPKLPLSYNGRIAKPWWGAA